MPIDAAAGPGRKTNIALWVLQVVLAGLFLFAGGMKLASSTDALAAMSDLPVRFMQFVGVLEVLGGLGLVLPGLLRIRPTLTALAASGLVLIMSGAVVATIEAGPAAGAVNPLVVGLLLAVVVRGRSVDATHRLG